MAAPQKSTGLRVACRRRWLMSHRRWSAVHDCQAHRMVREPWSFSIVNNSWFMANGRWSMVDGARRIAGCGAMFALRHSAWPLSPWPWFLTPYPASICHAQRRPDRLWNPLFYKGSGGKSSNPNFAILARGSLLSGRFSGWIRPSELPKRSQKRSSCH